MCPLFCFHLQAPPSTDDMPGEITGPLGADPADVVDAEGGKEKQKNSLIMRASSGKTSCMNTPVRRWIAQRHATPQGIVMT